ncbi:hypothetical protein Hrd1104_09085 [Halorhabdus sp. CBA1104]|uniref:hypothetical protein n=1 Tax=Halorhabdus sp. CBA1104 TaxID=1380432 RepID=UPI0012B3C4AA|nr:hypothetical protein [Halorhabdus sp. CBA1104]QGN07448.1 hypothetical protein Hrd1104_09085 [Halorhabdus sp. CBA1104]
MKLNRRSVLLGLGTAAAAVGGAFGSGAFSSVEATRTVELNTSADSDALLSFEPNNPGTGNNIITTESPNGNSLIKIQQTDLNEKATTTFTDALKVTNSGEKDVGLSVNPDESDDSNGLIGSVLDIQHDGASIVDGSTTGDNAVDLASGSSRNLTVVVDLQADTGAAIDSINSIVFAARQSDYTGA